VKDLASDTAGATAIEYALIATIISIVIVTALATIGNRLNTMLSAVSFTP
jgi:Flp pilus assembly pilin Flp